MITTRAPDGANNGECFSPAAGTCIALKRSLVDAIPKLSVNVFRSKFTTNCRHLCSSFPFLFASNKAKHEFGKAYSKVHQQSWQSWQPSKCVTYNAIHNKRGVNTKTDKHDNPPNEFHSNSQMHSLATALVLALNNYSPGFLLPYHKNTSILKIQ